MTPDQYRERSHGQLDAMRTAEKDQIILSFIEQLYPNGDPDHPVEGSEFVAEAIRLLAVFHPTNLKFPEEKSEPTEDPNIPTF